MKSLHNVIIKTKKTYNNVESIDGLRYTINVSIDDVSSINREAIVVSAPVGSGISTDDVVIVHHNIMRENINTDGKYTKGHFHIIDEYYHCPISEVIMKKVDGEWETLLNFVFIEPIKSESEELDNGFILVPDSYKGMIRLNAKLAISNSRLNNIDIGDIVIFSNYSEHEFIIDGRVLYKCEIEDILGKII